MGLFSPTSFRVIIAEAIRASGSSQRAVAILAQVHQSKFSAYLRGRCEIRSDTLERVMRVLELRVGRGGRA